MSNVQDASKWIILHLDRGKYQGKQILFEKAIEQALQPQAELKSPFFMYQRTGYGLGWYHAKFDKYNMIDSFGNFHGARSHISFLPEQKVGICVFINESGRGMFAPDLIANYGYGLLLGDENLLSLTQNELAKMANNFQTALKSPRTNQPKIELAVDELRRYEGEYSNQSFGTVEVKVLENKLFVKLGNAETFAVPSGKDSFVTDFPYFFSFKFVNDAIELNFGTKHLFQKA